MNHGNDVADAPFARASADSPSPRPGADGPLPRSAVTEDGTPGADDGTPGTDGGAAGTDGAGLPAGPGDRSAPPVHRARWSGLDPQTLHDLLRLRIDVFVVEQTCPYPELDGRDPDPGTEHVWLADGRGPAAYLRVLAEPDGSRRIGRVCTRRDARGRGLAGVLVDAVLGGAPGVRFVLDAQTYVAGFYAARGFAVTGPEFVEDGIPHVPMTREP